MNSHMIGPWEYGTPGDGGRINVYTDSTMSLRIARVDSGQSIPGWDVVAHAKLIASAPTLAKLAQDFARYLDDNEQGIWADDVRAALAKAGL